MSVTEDTRVYLGLGGNVGDVKAAMQWALAEIGELPGTAVFAVSPLYRTPPWGIKTQNWFLNACVGITTTLKPHHLLRELIDIEQRAGRVRHIRWGPRTLDIDILLFADYLIQTPDLTIPHPRMFERAFVMTPLADIADDLTHKGTRIRSYSENLVDAEMEVAERDWVSSVS